MSSLLSDAMEPCIMLNKAVVDDGYGGERTTWTNGAMFDAAIVFDTSVEARIAQAQGVTNLYTVTTPRTKVLQYHDVFRRLSDGKVFRVTSDGDDKQTPQSAGLDMRQVTAEQFTLTGN
jgi:hypothetical protein